MPILAGKSIGQNGLGLMRKSLYTQRLETRGANLLLGMTLKGDVIPEEKTFAVLEAALKAGANVWNGADFYGTPDYNTLHLMNRYFTAYPEDADKVVLTVKSGIADMSTFAMDCSPAAIRGFVDRANAILDGKKKIDLFGCGRVDPKVPIEETVRALGELVKEEKIGGIQLSEVSASTIRRAAQVATIDIVEAEISLWATNGFENGVAETCAELGITLVALTPLGAGMLTGRIKSPDDLPANDYHRFFPRFQRENLHINLKLVHTLSQLAEKRGCTSAELALSWFRAQSRLPRMPVIVPVFGARSEERVAENTRDIDLSDSDLEEIRSILDSCPVVGSRHPPIAAKLCEY
ncbi:aldo/keto reductase [Penicillium alfredii]|uniref:Aldo/keto reductase n=1 Tax=Penicillium alfredii TaxID=1506179 RepID=A0A9W9F9H6_9EURO|nr:aldo/keto reductase [Penicillium alfredii]KAJ5095929.1 aldo/keto reductase [Penicillium alfredii]